MEKTRQKAVRKAPGMGGHGRFYRIEVRPKGEFVTFRTQDVGKRDGLERVAGRHPGGSWETATWLVEKKDAHVSGGELIIDDPKARTVLKQIRGRIIHLDGDVFRAHPRRRTRGPTEAQLRARSENIKKARAARWNG